MRHAHPHSESEHRSSPRREACLGLRWQAKRDTAFARPTTFSPSGEICPHESAVVAALCRRSPRRTRQQSTPKQTECPDKLLGRTVKFCAVLLCFFLPVTSWATPPPTAEAIEFFESKIRPIFAENCYSCHSATEKIKGGLRLDAPHLLRKGGDSGPALAPGKPDDSLLIQAVRYTDENLQMPPNDKKLAADQIALLAAWVKMGAPVPEHSDAPRLMTEVAEARAKHWAFQPVRKPTPPDVKKSRWVETPVDNFILAKLEEKKLKPGTAGGSTHVNSPLELRLDRVAAHAGRSRGFRQRQKSGCVRKIGGSLVGIAALRRALGSALAGRGALCGHARLSRRWRRTALHVFLHVSRLCHSRVQ
jgi:hypothetical protein